jgi:hypothetical protein
MWELEDSQSRANSKTGPRVPWNAETRIAVLARASSNLPHLPVVDCIARLAMIMTASASDPVINYVKYNEVTAVG